VEENSDVKGQPLTDEQTKAVNAMIDRCVKDPERPPDGVNRASIDIACETCKKKERYDVLKIEDGKPIPNPARLLLTASPLCVMVTESRVSGVSMLFHRCLDPMCLLRNVKEALALYWVQDMQRKYVAAMQQQLGARKRSTKKKNNRKSKKRR